MASLQISCFLQGQGSWQWPPPPGQHGPFQTLHTQHPSKASDTEHCAPASAPSPLLPGCLQSLHSPQRREQALLLSTALQNTSRSRGAISPCSPLRLSVHPSVHRKNKTDWQCSWNRGRGWQRERIFSEKSRWQNSTCQARGGNRQRGNERKAPRNHGSGHNVRT